MRADGLESSLQRARTTTSFGPTRSSCLMRDVAGAGSAGDMKQGRGAQRCRPHNDECGVATSRWRYRLVGGLDENAYDQWTLTPKFPQGASHWYGLVWQQGIREGHAQVSNARLFGQREHRARISRFSRR